MEAAKDLRAKHWNIVKEAGITEIPSSDFSHYDNVLDATVLFNIVPKAVQNLDLTDLEKYFAFARGYQGEKGDVRARPMKKWFNTNYHYIVPAIEKDTEIKLAGHKIFDEFQEAKNLGITTRPVLIGPFTLLQLTDFEEGKETATLVATGFPADKALYAGIVNGKNIWRNNYEKSLAVLDTIPAENVVITTSCSLLHVPFTTANEEFEPAILNHFAFAVEKLSELRDLDAIRT